MTYLPTFYDLLYLENNIWHKGTFPQERKCGLGEETCGCHAGKGWSWRDWELGEIVTECCLQVG